jgi:hypothetical protein
MPYENMSLLQSTLLPRAYSGAKNSSDGFRRAGTEPSHSLNGKLNYKKKKRVHMRHLD